MDSKQWPLDQIIASMRCVNCYQDLLVDWATCIRRSAQCNLHPNFCSRERQMYYLVFHVVKYLKPADNVYPFQGDGEVQYHIYRPDQKDQRQLRSLLPKHLQKQTIVTRGK